jgi:hyperosmotically inducible protein
MHTTLRITGALLGIMGLGAVAQAAPPPDSWITTKVKLALFTGDDVSSTAIHVDTVEGDVVLHGKVHSAAEKERAGTIARGIDGVRQVRDLLQIVPKRDDKAVAMSDDHIKKSVSKVLKEEPTLKDSSISVKAVDKGVVLLAGTTDSIGDYLLAVECAHAVPGVRHVFSEVRGPDSKGEWKEPRSPAHGDSYVTAATKLRLIGDSAVSAFDINVDTDHGVVTLFGAVPTAAARAAAESDAHKVDGVTHVVNELEVIPSARRDQIKANDKVIRASLDKSFNDRGIEHVDYAVENGVVRLTGTVPTIWQQLRVANTARRVPGVVAVNDDLRVAQ